MPEVAVFDTNVLFSGIGWRGKPYRCLELARSGDIEGISCQEILNELTDKLGEKLNFSDTQISDTLADLLSFLRVVKIEGALRVVQEDPEDDKVLECAATGGATYIVSGDRRHLLPLDNYQGIPIVSPAEFLRLITGTESSET